MSKNKQPKMAFTRKPCVIATGIAISLMAAQSYAQTPAPAAATEKVEKIEVTGSRIPAANLESVSPVTIIDAATIKTDGVRSVENLLNNLPQVFAAQGASVSNGATGTATVNLRNLGASRTLVLVNGRRLPYGSPNSAAADLNQIPAPLIKRVEILTGGAGAVYGSDAVAGVVNFIMNDKFEGVQLELNQSFYNHQQQGSQGVSDIVAARQAGNPANFKVPNDKSSDGKIFDASILMGGNFANNKGNATVYLGYKKEEALLQSERDFSACTLNASIQTATTPSRFSCGGSGTNGTGLITNNTSGLGYTNQDSAGTARRYSSATDAYNFGPANYFQRPSERYTANAAVSYELYDYAKLYSEFSFMDYNSVAQIAPGGLFGTVTTVGFDNPLLSPSWRAALGLVKPGDTSEITVQRRNIEGGGRQSQFRNTSFRTVVGVKGDIGNWNYDAFMQTSKVVYQQNEANYFSSARAARALDVVNVNGVATCRSVVDGSDPSCVPYNPFRIGGVTGAQLSYLQTPGLRTGSTQQTIQGASVASDLGTYGIKLPSAKNGVSFALGVERRTEKLDLITDAATAAGDLSGSGGATPSLSGKFTVKDIFTEVRAPLIEGAAFADLLSINASYRNSDYSTGIKTNTYGFGVEYAPIKIAKFRGSYQQAVRAANVIELFTAQGLNLFDGNDPCGGPNPTAENASATAANCARTGVTADRYGKVPVNSAGQYNFLQGGNASLSPEKAKSTTFGIVLTPMQNVSATIDYFDIKIKDTIGIVNPQTTLDKCLETGAAVFCSLITRDRLGSLSVLPEGRIVGTNVNIGSTRTSGIDVGLNYTQKLDGMGSLGFNTNLTYLLKQETEEIKGQGTYDCVGYYGNKCTTPNPEFRHKTRFSWATPWNLDLALTWRFFGKVDLDTTSSNGLLNGSGTIRTADVNRTLGARNYFDFAAAYALTKQISLSGGVNNVLDKDPPITAVSGPSIFGNGNTFPQVYDALGRRFFLNATYKF